MLLNRIPHRVAAAAGAATVVAGVAFGAAAFADSGPEPAQTTEAAPQAEDLQFFAAGDELSPEELEALISEAEGNRETALEAASVGTTGSVSQEEEEEEEEEEDEEDADIPSVPSGSAREIAQGMLGDWGWGNDQWSCLDNLWEKESNWNHTAENPSSGAYGIPQALPGSKMASAGSDWQSNPATQISWGLGYIDDRYGSPCGAWSHSQANGWY